jgi:hypothetical protein
MEVKRFVCFVERGTCILPQRTGSSVLCVMNGLTKLVQIVEVLVTATIATCVNRPNDF